MLRLEGFEDFREIGSGGFSTVYRARQVALDRDVAIKVLESRRIDVSRVEREIVALGRLSGIANVITAYELRVLDDGRPALVMALMSTSLGDLTRQGVDHSQRLVQRWLPQVGAALDAAHARNVFHRDLKPDNILISEAGDAYLADFGISGVDTLEPSTTTAYSLTPHHASPERFAAEVDDPVADDIYSLGSTTYASLSGRPPFGTVAEGGVRGLIERVAHDPVPPIDGLPEATHQVFARVLAKAPDERYPSASEFAAALATAMADVTGPPPAPVDPDDGDLTRRRLPAATAPGRRTSSGPPPAAPSAVTPPPDPATRTEAGDALADRSTYDGAGGGRRRRATMAAVGALVLVILGTVGWLATRGSTEPAPSSSAAGDRTGWRAELVDLRGGADIPDGLLECMADRIADETADPAEFVDELAADAAAMEADDPAAAFREGSDERAAEVDGFERDCVPEVIPVGTEMTVTGNATQVELTRDSACALLEDGTSACWASNWDELAFDDEGFGPNWIEFPVESRAPRAKQLVAAPYTYRCVISLEDELHCLNSLVKQLRGDDGDMAEPDLFGSNNYLVASDSVGEFVQLEWAGKVRDAALGNRHGCVVRTDGTVSCVGSNEFGQLGDGTRDDRAEPVQVPGLAGAVSVTAGTNQTCATLTDGAVWCWGVDGVELTTWQVSPVRIDGLPPITQLAGGASFTCGVGADGSLWCWGRLVEVLGDRSLEGTRGPVRIDTGVGVTQVDAFELRACFASTGREMFCFGDGRPLPERIENVTDIVQVSISEFVTCGRDGRGEVDCVGRVGALNELGQPTEDDNVFVVPGLGNQG